MSANTKSTQIYCLIYFILGLTAISKLISLSSGDLTLKEYHPILGVQNKWLITIASFTELGVIYFGLMRGRQALYRATISLCVVWLIYHLIESFSVSQTRCACLGQIAAWSPFLSRYEKEVAISIALVLLYSAMLGISNFQICELLERMRAWERPRVDDWYFSAIGGAALLITFVTLAWQARSYQLGGDEGLELGKAMLLSARPDLWSSVWNDQPPGFTFIGAVVGRIFGFTLFPMRVTVLIASFIILAVYYLQMARDLGGASPLISFVLFLQFGMSAMCIVSGMPEAVAYSLGFAAVLPLLNKRIKIDYRLVLSSVIAAAALLVKFTAVFSLVLVPYFIIVNPMLGMKRGNLVSRLAINFKMSWAKCLLWFGMTFGIVGLAALILPGWEWKSMFGAHSLTIADVPRTVPEYYLFNYNIFLGNLPVVAAACIGIILAFCYKMQRLIVPWMVLFSFALISHFRHVPWWWYYDIHLGAPLAAMAGIGVVLAVKTLVMLAQASQGGISRHLGIACAIVVALLWLRVGGFAVRQSFVTTLASEEPVDSGEVVEYMRRYRNPGGFAFGNDYARISMAGILQPPELLILSKKRFWSGQITDQDVRDLVKKYRPEHLVLPENYTWRDPDWEAMLAREYVFAARTRQTFLYVRTNLLSESPIDKRDALGLRRLGL